MAGFAGGLVNVTGFWDSRFPTTPTAWLVSVITLGLMTYGAMGMVQTCMNQFNFSVQNPW